MPVLGRSSQKWVKVLVKQAHAAAETGIIEEIWDSPEDSVLSAPMPDVPVPSRVKRQLLRRLGHRLRQSRPFGLMAGYVRSRRLLSEAAKLPGTNSPT